MVVRRTSVSNNNISVSTLKAEVDSLQNSLFCSDVDLCVLIFHVTETEFNDPLLTHRIHVWYTYMLTFGVYGW